MLRNGGQMNKKTAAVVMAAAVMFGSCKAVWAEESLQTPTRQLLQSDGRIVYQEGNHSVVLDSQDLYRIADRMDLFKLGISRQLASLGTYLTTGEGIPMQTSDVLKVTHVSPAQEYSVDPLTVDFNALLEGVAASQSVPADSSAYGYEMGTTLYQTKEGVLTTVEDEAACAAVQIRPATAENLSAGTAAWVDGHLLLGTGEDNRHYFEQGHGQTSETIVSIIDLLYSGINETAPYAISGREGYGVSVSISSKETEGPYEVKVKSDLIPVWNLEGEEKKLLTKLRLDVDAACGGSRLGKGQATEGRGSISYIVYDENGQAIGSGSDSSTKEFIIDVMALQITTQHIYVEAEGSVYVYKTGSGSGTGSAHINFQGVQATYLIN